MSTQSTSEHVSNIDVAKADLSVVGMMTAVLNQQHEISKGVSLYAHVELYLISYCLYCES